MKSLRSLTLLALACALSGCLGSVLPKASSRAAFALPDPQPLSARRELTGALLVELPRALPPIDGEDVVVVRANGEVQLLPGVRWIAPIPELVRQLLARQLEAAGSATSVSQSAQAHALPLRLGSDLNAFQLRESADGSLSVHAVISVRLICALDSSVLAASTALTADARPVAGQPGAAVAALRAASADLARQLVAWLDQVDVRACGVR